MAVPQKTLLRDLEIVEVREPEFDPVVGESVWIALRIRSSSTQRAASGVEVTFTAEQSPVRVITDGEGWARYAYKAEQARDVEVIATLLNVEDEPGTAPTHSFSFKSLAASGWDDARIQLDNEASEPWGVPTLFPRTAQAHTIRLVVDNLGSPLLGREIYLGLKGHSSAEALGFTTQPALGESRVLTAEGLIWQCNGTFSWAYNLQLVASRLLKQSPLNAISLGPVTPGGLPADIIFRAGDQLCVIKNSRMVVKIALGSPVEFCISVPPEGLNESVSFQLLGDLGMGFDPGLNSPRTFNELTLTWTVIASRWNVEDYVYKLTFSKWPDSPLTVNFLVE